MKDKNVSFAPAVNDTAPALFVVPINCFLIVSCVSDAPLLVAVNSVLIILLDSLYNAMFFSALTNLPTCSDSKASVVELSSSRTMLSFTSVELSSVPSITIWPSVPVDVLSKTISAVKSWPLSSSSINTDLVSLNWWVTILAIVKSALLEFSTILSVSALSEAVIFSPTAKVPDTFVTTTCVPEVKEPNINPVAPDVTPLICTPPFAWLDTKVAEGMSFNVK